MADRREIQRPLQEAVRLLQAAGSIAGLSASYHQEVRTSHASMRSALADDAVAAIPVSRLSETAKGLRLSSIEAAGISTLGELLSRGRAGLVRIPGVGPETAAKCIAAASQVKAATMSLVRVRFDLVKRPDQQTALLDGVRRYGWAVDLEAEAEPAVTWAKTLAPTIAEAELATKGWSSRFFAGKAKRAESEAALAHIVELVSSPPAQQVRVLAGRADAIRTAARAADEIWQDYESHAAQLLGLLAEITGADLGDRSGHGDLSKEIIDRVNQQELDRSLLIVGLRGYQAFGAKYALVQKRSVLGDEMGLGKTIEALAVMCHLSAAGQGAALVVCPASVVANWRNEIIRHSKLTPHVVHGAEREHAFRRWERDGGVAITTFDHLKRMHLPAPMVDGASQLPLLVVDEAHYAKNLRSQRSKAVAAWASRADRVIFLSGTPMENRVEEFRSLVGLLNPTVAQNLTGSEGLAGAAAFRANVAPVYLRRNQADVLDELPDKIESFDWVDPTDDDLAAYRHEVLDGTFMGMRRVAFLSARTGGPLTRSSVQRSAKLDRLVDLVEEATEDGLKVIVFSYFREVLDVVTEAAVLVCANTIGPLTGSVGPVARQEMVERLARCEGSAVLTAQIEAGGTGLNIQAASVVILCEPQWKPSIEAQAIARSHRMGQVRRVQVHRLLIPDGVDEHMLRILAKKSELFDAYVTTSAIKDLAPEAIDISDLEAVQNVASQAEAERQIVEAERRRIAFEDARSR